MQTQQAEGAVAVPKRPKGRPTKLLFSAADGFTHTHTLGRNEPLPRVGGYVTLGERFYLVRSVKRAGDTLHVEMGGGRDGSPERARRILNSPLRRHSLGKRRR